MMRHSWRWMQWLALVLAVGASAALAQAPELTVKDAWARMPLAPQNNSAVYVTLENSGATARSVVSVSTADAERAELHETRMEGGMMRMAPTKEVSVPARGSAELKPGGYHVMLFGVKKAVKAGDHLDVALKLNDGATVAVSATVRAADAAAGGMPSGSGRAMRGMN